jgi:tetratricopeptide (TPR) repeat protein
MKRTFACAALWALVACKPTSPRPSSSAPAAPPATPPLGTYHRATSCLAGSDAFDDGLRLYYAFDLESAERAFRRVPRGCAIGQWGVALALGHNLNVPSMPSRRVAARGVLDDAQGGSAVEVALIGALRQRYAGDDISAGDHAYAAAMREVHAKFPNDPDVAALFAEALLDLHPFAQWATDGTPRYETPELVALLEGALGKAPDHPGLNHFYIHTMEASPHPEKAITAADKIGVMMPAAGHLVHMPSHIYMRLGRYADAAAQNRRAIDADKAWEAAGKAGPIYAMYPLHDHHFHWLATLALGRQKEARAEADLLAAAATPERVAAMPGMETLLVAPALTNVRFGEWGAMLTLAPPPDEEPFAAGVWHYGRARAFAASHRDKDAERELTALQQIIERTPKDRMMGANAAIDVLRIAMATARGDLLARTGRDGAPSLVDAVKRYAQLAYDEPPSWPLSPRLVLGRVYLDQKRYADAGQVFRDELAAQPGLGWALLGLRAAEAGLGHSTAEVDARLKTAFQEGDRVPALDAL